MKEKSRASREILGSQPQALGDMFSNGATDGAVVTVAHGPYAEQLPVGNMSVREIRSRYQDRFDIDPHSVAVLDGGLADEDTLVRANQTLMFIRRAGEKGCAAAGFPGDSQPGLFMNPRLRTSAPSLRTFRLWHPASLYLVRPWTRMKNPG